MKVYVISYIPYGGKERVVSPISFLKRKDAEAEAKQLRACEHESVRITVTEVR